MTKIDAIDEKIAFLLGRNARLSQTALAKAVGASREVVGFRLKRLKLNKILSGSTVNVNFFRLGMHSFHVLLRERGGIPEQIDALEKALISEPYITSVQRVFGNWNYLIMARARHIQDLARLFDALFSKFPTIVEAKQFFVLDEFGPGWSILIPEKQPLPKMPNDRAAFTAAFASRNTKELTTIDEVDERILLALSEDATKGITQLSAEVTIGYRNTMDRLQRMIKEGVINGFDTRGSIASLGFSQATVLLRIANIEKNEHRAREFLGSLRECSRYWRLLGMTQFRVNLYARTTEEFDHTIKKIKTFFRSDLIDLESVDIIEQMKRIGFSTPLKLK